MKSFGHLALCSLLFVVYGCVDNIEAHEVSSVEVAEEPVGGEPSEALATTLTGCTYYIKRTQIKAVYRENVADYTLELRVDVKVTYPLTSSTLTWGKTSLKVDNSDYSSATVFTETVPDGTLVVHNFKIDVTEYDTGLNPNDYGHYTGAFSFTCTGTGSRIDEPTIDVDDGSQVLVAVSALW